MTSHKCPTNAHSFAASLRYIYTNRYTAKDRDRDRKTEGRASIKSAFVILVVKSINATKIE